jgi:hypothetical protein
LKIDAARDNLIIAQSCSSVSFYDASYLNPDTTTNRVKLLTAADRPPKIWWQKWLKIWKWSANKILTREISMMAFMNVCNLRGFGVFWLPTQLYGDCELIPKGV